MPIRLRLETPMSDEELSLFSEENSPFRMEREPNGEILIMTPTVTDSGFIITGSGRRSATGRTRMAEDKYPIQARGSSCQTVPFVRLTRRGSAMHGGMR